MYYPNPAGTIESTSLRTLIAKNINTYAACMLRVCMNGMARMHWNKREKKKKKKRQKRGKEIKEIKNAQS